MYTSEEVRHLEASFLRMIKQLSDENRYEVELLNKKLDDLGRSIDWYKTNLRNEIRDLIGSHEYMEESNYLQAICGWAFAKGIEGA